MTAPKVVVVGSSNTDLVIQCDELPIPGQTILGGRFQRYAGGKGANQAVAAARAGCQTVFVGARGDDDFGRAAQAGLDAEGIDTQRMITKDGHDSGIALILIGGATRENMIAVADSANGALSADDVVAAQPAIAQADVIVTQLEIPMEAVTAVATAAANADVPLVLNPAPSAPLAADLLAKVHTITPNQEEATSLTGCDEPEAAARALQAAGCQNVVITLGGEGALVVTADGCVKVPSVAVSPVDTVGAGDCFTAWLAAGIGRGDDLVQAATRASRAAALAVTREGAQAGMPYETEIDL